MSDNKVKIGIVGCGNIAPIHAEAINTSKYGMLISVFSRSASNIKKMKDRFNVVGYDDFEKFLSDPNLDAVSLCTPNGTHLEYAEKAAQAGKHVIIEKPIEVDIHRAKRIIDICKENNVKLAVIYQNRFLDDVIKMKKIVDSGVLGKVFMSDARIKWYRDQQYYDNAEWRGSLKLDGDIFYLLDEQNKVINEDNNSVNTGGSSPLDGFSIEPHKKQFEQIFDAIINNKKPVVSGEESLKSLAFVKAVYESSENRTEVNYNGYLDSQ